MLEDSALASSFLQESSSTYYFLYEWMSCWWPDALGWNVNSNMTDTVINSCVNDNSAAPLIDCLPILTNDHNFWDIFENLVPRRMRASDQLLDHIDRIIKLFFDVKIMVHHPHRGTVTTPYSRNEGQRKRGLRHVGLPFCHTLTLFCSCLFFVRNTWTENIHGEIVN